MKKEKKRKEFNNVALHKRGHLNLMFSEHLVPFVTYLINIKICPIFIKIFCLATHLPYIY